MVHIYPYKLPLKEDGHTRAAPFQISGPDETSTEALNNEDLLHANVANVSYEVGKV